MNVLRPCFCALSPAVCALLIACAPETTEVPHRLSLTPATANACLGDTLPLRAIRSGVAIEAGALRWHSPSPAVATVDAAGIVHAVGIGNATIAAFDQSTNDSAVTFISVNPLASGAQSIEHLYRTGTSESVSSDSLSGAVDVVTHVPSHPGCLSAAYDTAALLVRDTTGAVLRTAASLSGSPMPAGTVAVLTFNTAALQAGRAVYANGVYYLTVRFVHHGSFGLDELSGTQRVVVRNP